MQFWRFLLLWKTGSLSFLPLQHSFEFGPHSEEAPAASADFSARGSLFHKSTDLANSSCGFNFSAGDDLHHFIALGVFLHPAGLAFFYDSWNIDWHTLSAALWTFCGGGSPSLTGLLSTGTDTFSTITAQLSQLLWHYLCFQFLIPFASGAPFEGSSEHPVFEAAAFSPWGSLIATFTPLLTFASTWCVLIVYNFLGVGSLQFFSLALGTSLHSIPVFAPDHWHIDDTRAAAHVIWCFFLLLAQSIALEIAHLWQHFRYLYNLTVAQGHYLLSLLYSAIGVAQLLSARQHCEPGPNSRGVHLQLPRWPVLLLVLCCAATMTTPLEGRWGEGTVPTTGHREVLTRLFEQMHLDNPGANLRGLGPQRGRGHTETTKRSYRRACRRALQQGCAWYKGQCLSPSQFPVDLRNSVQQQIDSSHPQVPSHPLPSADIAQVSWTPNKVHSPKHRLKIFQWNPSGLSSSRYAEFLHWLNMQSFDVVCLSETNWKADLEWLTPQWTCIHTGDPHGHAGVMILVAKRLCPANKVSWQTLTEGRVLHVRLHLGLRNYDVVGVYQWPHQHANKPKRFALLQTLDRLLSGLPKRNLLALIGDFNTSVHSCPGVVGTSYYTVKAVATMGAQHTDTADFASLMQRHELCVLNSWNQQDGPTFCGPLSTS
eukprot:s700_g8.t1